MLEKHGFYYELKICLEKLDKNNFVGILREQGLSDKLVKYGIIPTATN